MFSSVTLQIICNLLVFLFWHAFHLSFQSLYGASLYIGLSLSKFILLSLYLRIFLTCVDFVFTHVVLYTLMFFLLPLVPLVLFHIDIRFPPPLLLFLLLPVFVEFYGSLFHILMVSAFAPGGPLTCYLPAPLRPLLGGYVLFCFRRSRLFGLECYITRK